MKKTMKLFEVPSWTEWRRKHCTVILPSCHKEISRWPQRYPTCPNTCQVQSCALSFSSSSAHFYYVCLHVKWGLLNAEALAGLKTVFSIPSVIRQLCNWYILSPNVKLMPPSYQPQTDRLMSALEQTWHQLFHKRHYIFSSVFFSHFRDLNL